ncbi:flavonol synthase/flavanone 3-hydroxylase-like [Chenopodium quinoa]|uniref:Fe2OG dioxygenase domain-containing protein n=1 Tax=Chenopodium quinoa TaxID=63459 RepID=A0A803LL25_CHEQI|nr:flavonol synthase/flavanone 3-hydroxylase-like [Chenopodium quinoa]
MAEVGRVQSMASNTISEDTIPSNFIWPETDQPAITTIQDNNFEIPVIELNDTDEDRLVKLIAKASSETGLFQIINHAIPSEVIEKLQKVGKEFFELPQQEKEKYGKLPGSIEGYGTSLQKEDEGKTGVKKQGWVDHIFHRIWPQSAINLRFWPKIPASYQEANEEYAKYLRVVGDKLFKCLSLGLGLEGHELKEGLGGDKLEYLMKINYYPPCPRPDLALGVPAHTDMSAITLLIPNGVPGLQVRRDGGWCDVKYIPNAIIIHIGDQIEIMSNGKYKAVLHRTTVTKDRTRMSWPVFLEPPLEHTVGPIPKLVNDENPAKYKTKKYRDYTYCKFNNKPQ